MNPLLKDFLLVLSELLNIHPSDTSAIVATKDKAEAFKVNVARNDGSEDADLVALVLRKAALAIPGHEITPEVATTLGEDVKAEPPPAPEDGTSLNDTKAVPDEPMASQDVIKEAPKFDAGQKVHYSFGGTETPVEVLNGPTEIDGDALYEVKFPDGGTDLIAAYLLSAEPTPAPATASEPATMPHKGERPETHTTADKLPEPTPMGSV